MILKFNEEIQEKFNDFYVGMVKISDIANEFLKPIKSLKANIIKDTLKNHNLNSLKNELTFRLNRDFFWKIGIDPTKKRPASEALIRRILRGNDIPKINPYVDLYNLLSIKHEVAIAGFDNDRLVGDLIMLEANEGERFWGIGMKKPLTLNGNEIVLKDSENIIAIYPYRDAEYSKLRKNTKNILLLTCGVPEFPLKKLEEATKDLHDIFIEYFGGSGEFKIFNI
jgi:DNA/RNA-binding domain of Phe-tRNA-synthetase-like protein